MADVISEIRFSGDMSAFMFGLRAVVMADKAVANNC